MSDRDTILRQIRTSLRTGLLPSAAPTVPARPTLAPLPADPVQSFRSNLEAVRGRVHGPLSPEAAVGAVAALLREAGAGEVLSWPLAEVGLPGLAECLAEAGLTLVDPTVPDDAAGRAEALQRLAQVPVGLTGAQAGLSDTGSLVLIHGVGLSRLASLLPAAHVAVLFVDTLYAGLPAYWAASPEPVAQTSNVVIVTGPSRTADIELTPVFGVHGPRRLDVVLVSR